MGRILETVFGRILRGLYATVHNEPCDLLAHYQFDARWAPSVRRKVTALVGDAAAGDQLTIAGRPVWNVCDFYERALADLPRRPEEQTRMAWVHGDLNGANVILDAQGNVWLIDFFHTGPGHVLKDLLKLENDLFYILTPLEDDAALAQALTLTDGLCEVDDLAAPLPPPEALGITHPGLARTWQTAGILRGFYPELLGPRRDPMQALIAMVRYAVHTLSFDESDVRQKQWALYTAGRAARRLTDDLHRSVPLRVDWLETGGAGRVGLTILPGRRDRGRDAAADIARLTAERVTDVLCLLPDGELAAYGVPDLLGRYRAAGLGVRQAPIADQSVPTLAEATGGRGLAAGAARRRGTGGGSLRGRARAFGDHRRLPAARRGRLRRGRHRARARRARAARGRDRGAGGVRAGVRGRSAYRPRATRSAASRSGLASAAFVDETPSAVSASRVARARLPVGSARIKVTGPTLLEGRRYDGQDLHGAVSLTGVRQELRERTEQERGASEAEGHEEQERLLEDLEARAHVAERHRGAAQARERVGARPERRFRGVVAYSA